MSSFNNQYHPSCFLEREPTNRGKTLRKSGNESHAAWLIVINSLMRNAQVLLRGNLQGVYDNTDQLLHYDKILRGHLHWFWVIEFLLR